MPLITTLGNASARAFNPGGGGGGVTPVYIARVTGLANEALIFPGDTNFMTNTWSHGGGNADAGTINLSGSGTYQLYSLSMGKRVSASGNIPTITLRVYSGNSLISGNLISSQNITYPALTDTTSPYQCQELVFPTPVTLNRGTTYSIAYGMATPGLGVDSGAINGPNDGLRTSYSVSAANGGGTLTFGDVAGYSDSDPFDTTNGTGFVTYNSGSGQMPVIGLIL